jgi:epoxyqueuosine reductase
VTITAGELRAVGEEAGLDAVGFAPARPFISTRVELQHRRAAGLHAGMAFTYRNPTRSTDPAETVRDARSLVVGARSYARGAPPPGPGPSGRVARYARTDHYAPLRAGLRAVASRLAAEGWRAVVVADENALVDREAAYRAGLGWYGKNANLLLPERGSWFVLGSVVTDAPIAATAAPVADGCGSCRRCIDACPTGAIVAPGVVDARRCLAWLVQQPGTFPRRLRAALGDRIYGCDDCQEVCPPNVRAGRRRTDGESDAVEDAWVPLLELLGASDDELLDRYGRWYLAGRQPRWLRRNALVALGNVGDGADPAVVAALRGALGAPDTVLRSHAVWAAARLGRTDLLAAVDDDPSPDVQAELAVAAGAPRR